MTNKDRSFASVCDDAGCQFSVDAARRFVPGAMRPVHATRRWIARHRSIAIVARETGVRGSLWPLGVLPLLILPAIAVLGRSRLSLGWRSIGVNAVPVMQNPLRSGSLAEFWGRRWNTAFHELAARFTFRPLQPMVGRTGATVLVFLVSGLIHELVISVPARGGYGLPTAYFVLQGLGVASERTRPGRRIGLGRGWLFTVVVAAAPAFWLFPPSFVRSVILPMLAFIGAT